MRIKCPSCGAEFDIESGLKLLKCPYCKSSIFISEETGTLEKIIPIISYDNAKENFLKRNIKEDFELIYIPFYKVLRNNEEVYIVGLKDAIYELKNFTPQGDRIPIEKKIVELEVVIENPVSLVFSPFYKTKNGLLMCAVTGNIINDYSVYEGKKINLFPLLIFFISGILALFIKRPFLKLTIPLIISFFIFIKRDEKNSIS